ncbi:MAG: hypothetical protein IJF78_03690 [Clostridia bacterium]|nr:hypothetical protein [Clostridia bacterium]
MKTNRSIAFLLSLLLLSGTVLTACSESTADKESKETSAQAAETPESAVEETETSELDQLPAAENYDGYEFNFITVEHTWQEYDQMCFDELTGESVKDAVINRNNTVGDLLDVTFKEQYDSDSGLINKVRSCVSAGDNSIDTAVVSVATANVMYNEGTITDLTGTLDLDAPWWYKNFTDYVNINPNNAKFVAYGRLDMSYVGCFMVMAINTELITEYQLDAPYTVYNEGRWTYDHMYENIQMVATDKDGDGVIADFTKDIIGAVGADNQFSLMLCSSGEQLAVKQDDTFVLSPTERLYNVYDKIVQLVNDPASCFKGVPGKDYEYYWTIFNEGRSLYMSNAIAAFRSARDGEIPYALLPYPKADETQQDYYNVISNYVAGMSIPSGKSEEDMARTGMILEYLSAYSGPLFDAFVEATLYHKYARDEESIQVFKSMLDIIPYYDLGLIYDWGGIRSKIDSSVYNSSPLASSIKSITKVFNKAAKKTMGQE